MIYLLDTSTCIDVLRGRAVVASRLRQVPPADVAVSVITVHELFAGVGPCRDPERERAKVEFFLTAVHVLPYLAVAAERAAAVRVELERQGLRIGPYDLLLAGQALASDLTLVTSNTVEFARVRGLRLADWRQSSEA